MPNRCSPIGLIDFPDRTARHSSTNFDRESSRFHRAPRRNRGRRAPSKWRPLIGDKGAKKEIDQSEDSIHLDRIQRNDGLFYSESLESLSGWLYRISIFEGDLQSCEVCQVWRVDGPITTHGTAVARRRSYPKTPVNKTDKMASASMTMAAAPVARTTRLVSARRAFSAALLMSGKKQTLSGAQIAR